MATSSACLVVWNGEDEIRGCLESIKKVVDEIIVVHDGPCSDRKKVDERQQHEEKTIILNAQPAGKHQPEHLRC